MSQPPSYPPPSQQPPRMPPPMPPVGGPYPTYEPLPPENRKPLAALICGILGLTVCFPLSIVAVVVGHVAKGELDAAGRQDGRDMAQVGFVLGIIGILLAVAFVLGLVWWFIL